MRSRRSVAELVRRGEEALDKENLSEAEALARRALMLSPESPVAKRLLATVLLELGRFEEAVESFEEVLEAEPEDVEALADLGICLYEICEFQESESVLARALELAPDHPKACYWMGLCVERRDDYRGADEYLVRAHEIDPEAFPAPTRLTSEEFDQAVSEAIEELPSAIHNQLDNLTITVADLPREDDLVGYDPPLPPWCYGLYVGVPLPERTTGDLPKLPDEIHIYKRNLERICGDHEHLIEEIRITVLHEVGHYLGFDEEELEERGLA